MIELPKAFEALGAYNQFVIYRLEASRTHVGKTDKFPCDFRTGNKCDAHDPQYWTTATNAINASYNLGCDGIGFVLTSKDPFFCVDIDNALIDGQWSTLAIQLCNLFTGCAIEISQSNKGLHIFGTGKVPTHGSKNVSLGIELYTEKRFIALTGYNAVGDASSDMSLVLPQFVAQYFPSSNGVISGDEWTTEARSDWTGPADDDALIEKARNANITARAAFSGRASFNDLWIGNIEALSSSYPDPIRPYDYSSADAGLAQHLAFWTGCNCQRIYDIMHKSALVRDKWQRDDYMRRTILRAVGSQDSVYNYSRPTVGEPPSQGVIEQDASLISGSCFMDPSAQLNFFKNCTYVRNAHKVLIPGGIMLKPEQFKVSYGGYSYAIDMSNEKTTKDSWEAFTLSQAVKFPKADLWGFKPDLPFGTIYLSGGLRVVNTYSPVEVKRKVGDATPFLNHLSKIIPNERDRLITLSYLAACVQYVGIKFSWCLIMQGIQGNGKSMLSQCTSEAIGKRYVAYPAADKIGNQFNSWLINHVLYVVEDAYVNRERFELVEKLKPMITSDYKIEIEMKGVDQEGMEICGNFIFNVNKKNALPIDDKERRYCIIYTAQQEDGDLHRDGLDGEYMPQLWDWLKKEDGFAIVNELLHTFPIPKEFNPTQGCHRAPITTSTASAIRDNMGPVEMEIDEAIARGDVGFRNGWISSIKLKALLADGGLGRQLNLNRRKEILKGMGYISHPGLKDGQVNNPVLPDGGKPKLYVIKGHETCHMQGREVELAYEASNNILSGVFK